ncbi:MAG: peptide-methionine (S)-S-oxide reductase MsrA [Hyphomicrobiaceae bacterium]
MRRSLLCAALALLACLAASGAEAQRNPSLERVIFAGGCFWCTESDFDKVPGVVSTISGYIGGKTENPTYKSVSSGTTGHTEGVEVVYDKTKVSFQKLVDYYWRTVDVLDKDGQFCDRGDHYRPEIFVTTAEQRTVAEASKAALTASKRFSKPIVVPITDASKFTAAEDYHQDYYNKNPLRYVTYRVGCGRDSRLEALWGSEAGGKKLLTN